MLLGVPELGGVLVQKYRKTVPCLEDHGRSGL